MIGIYFSGTGNSKYCIEKFLQEYDSGAEAFSIENEELLIKIREHEDLVFSYPVQFSNLPKIVKDFVDQHHQLWSLQQWACSAVTEPACWHVCYISTVL